MVEQGQKKYIDAYHTQEHRFRDPALTEPCKCKSVNAWLGVGYYFWIELEFAHYWGADFKTKATGSYDIYKCRIDISKCIDTAFDYEGYKFYVEKIEQAINYFEQEGKRYDLDKINRFLSEKVWKPLGIKGIIYEDMPSNPFDKDRIYSSVNYMERRKYMTFYYKKRVQIALFDLTPMSQFEIYLEDQNS